jgi:hypothetical protein
VGGGWVYSGLFMETKLRSEYRRYLRINTELKLRTVMLIQYPWFRLYAAKRGLKKYVKTE